MTRIEEIEAWAKTLNEYGWPEHVRYLLKYAKAARGAFAHWLNEWEANSELDIDAVIAERMEADNA